MRRTALVLGLSTTALGCSAPPRGLDLARSTEQALVVQCPTRTAEGIDVFDGQGVVDWSSVADAGVAFAFIKATQGTYDTQATFAGNWAGAAAAGVRRGAYHFFDPTEDGEAQAAHFLSIVGPLVVGDLPPMLDVECPDGDSNCLGTGGSGATSAVDIADRTRAFLRAVEEATGRVPVVYTFASYFASNAVDAAGLDAFPLFLAYPTEDSCFPVPAPWSQASVWQYSWEGRVPGIEGAVDRDRWVGELPALPEPPADGSASGTLSTSSAWATAAPAAPPTQVAASATGALPRLADATAEPATDGGYRARGACRMASSPAPTGSALDLAAVVLWVACRRRRTRRRLPARPPAC
jgi:lysozyme